MFQSLRIEFDDLKDNEVIMISLKKDGQSFVINNSCELEFTSEMVIITRELKLDKKEKIYIPKDSILYFKKSSK